MVLAFLIPLSLGWDQAATAGITIMLIASSTGVHESISKGIIRVVGTIIGAIIGLSLIAIFPQERVLYLVSLSIILSIIIYLYYAYRGDSSVFMLSAMVIMMIFLHGPENAFLYGLDRTFMTIFGIVIYTFVGVFLWPNHDKKEIDEESDFVTPSSEDVKFVLLDPDNFKATLQLLSVFWSTTLFWIIFNPPGGFLLVILATLLGLFTTFSPLKPSLLMALLSFGFVFATLMYTFVLPNLVYSWELAIFIFTYSFIAFYFIPPKISIFFLIGMFLLGIDNTMNYNFALFLNILLVFYLFLIILMLFHNFPFSTKPEHLFIKLKHSFINHLQALHNTKSESKKKFHLFYLKLNIQKMQLWSSKIDLKYFNNTTKEKLEHFIKECELTIKKIQTPLNDKEKKSIILHLNEQFDDSSLKVNRF